MRGKRIRNSSFVPLRNEARNSNYSEPGIVTNHDSTNGFIHFRLSGEKEVRCHDDGIIDPPGFLPKDTPIEVVFEGGIVARIKSK